MVRRQRSPARAPSPARGGGGSGSGSVGGTEGTSPPRPRHMLSINKGRLSPVITPVMRGIRRIRRSASADRRTKKDDDQEDNLHGSHSKITSRLPFFHSHSPHAAPPPPSSRPSQSDAASTASAPTPPLSTNKKPSKSARSHSQSRRPQSQPSSPTSSQDRIPSPTSPSGGGEIVATINEQEKQGEQQTVPDEQQEHASDDRMSYANRFRLNKGLSGLDKKSLDNMSQIKKDIMEMRTNRRNVKVKFTGNENAEAAASHTDTNDGESTLGSSASKFISPKPHSRVGVKSMSTTPGSSSSQRHHYRPKSSGTPKKKMGLSEITMGEITRHVCDILF